MCPYVPCSLCVACFMAGRCGNPLFLMSLTSQWPDGIQWSSWCPSAENSANQKGVPRQTRESLFLVPNWIRQISTWCWVAPWQELQSSVGICRNMHCPKVDATPTYTNLYLWHRTSWTTTWMVHITASTPLSRCHVVLVVKESIHHLIPPGMRWQDSQGAWQSNG